MKELKGHSTIIAVPSENPNWPENNLCLCHEPILVISDIGRITFWVALLAGSQQMVLMRLLSSLTQYANDAAKRAAGTCPF